MLFRSSRKGQKLRFLRPKRGSNKLEKRGLKPNKGDLYGFRRFSKKMEDNEGKMREKFVK